MKVLQLIDSLKAGGAERVAVNYANALTSRVETSYLCATREEGLLKESVSREVGYLFLNKKSTLDFKSINKLRRFIKVNGIEIIHAHASSFFMATIIKILNPKLVLIWHDHYGNSEYLNERPTFVLTWCSKLFNHIITVNAKLEDWCKSVLLVKNVSPLQNFAVVIATKAITTLGGETNKRIVCLANLRPQKDHLNLLQAFKNVHNVHKDWTLHLVGEYDEDEYYKTIKSFIQENKLEKHVFIYGSCADVHHILSQSAIGVLSSKSEGLPLALLEYGLAKIPVIATNTGDCNKVISNPDEGLLVESENDIVLAEALIKLINDEELRSKVAKNLNSKVSISFSESSIINSLVQIYKKHIK